MNSNSTLKLQAELDKQRQINEELEKRTRLQNLKIERLTEEKKDLAKQILKERRLRYATRNLVVGIDKAIMAQIERLNTAPNQQIKPLRQQAIDADKSDARVLAAALQATDLEAYYSRKGASKPRRRIIYKFARTIYAVPRFVAVTLLKSLLHLRRTEKKDS